jgi:hypothetical protein
LTIAAPAPGVAESAGAATGLACGCLRTSGGCDLAATDRLGVPGALVIAVDDCDIVGTFTGTDIVLEAGIDVPEARSEASGG